ncbi:FCD domain-containing protein [Halomonas sp. HP20-15]|uniref:FadR/GntR family transcriptional regulator n=1 Tax=Halomonas sp. HP20-15 TaxID=3085901 RepID=UPI0029816CBA|nr:FCD domain-containing protein [Halomonas sp. HP20-15]MDW5377251.1 FCD domain-containing protein [Halomonas sp. HP20-15]
MPTPRTAKRQKIADLICEDIKHWIVTEGLQPGDRLPNEKALMERYECAKGTIREALRVLEVEGLVQMKTGPSGGAVIREVTIDPACRALRNFLHFQHVDGSQVYQLRRLVEVEIADSVVECLDAAGFARLRTNIAQCQRPHDDELSQRQHRMLELEFHNVLAEYCPNPLLRFVSQFLNDLLRDLVVIKKAYKPERHAFDEANIRYHIALVEAFEAQDREQVRQLMHDHMCDAEHHMAALEAEVVDQFLVLPETLKEAANLYSS